MNRANLARAGVFEVPVPDDFKIDASGPDKTLVAHDAQRTRRLRVQSVPLADAGRWISPRSEGQTPIPFRHLHVTGVLDVQRGVSLSDEGAAILSRLRAWAAVPSSKRMVVITLDVSSDVSETDQELIEDIATGVSLAKDKDVPTSTPRRTPIEPE